EQGHGEHGLGALVGGIRGEDRLQGASTLGIVLCAEGGKADVSHEAGSSGTPTFGVEEVGQGGRVVLATGFGGSEVVVGAAENVAESIFSGFRLRLLFRSQGQLVEGLLVDGSSSIRGRHGFV